MNSHGVSHFANAVPECWPLPRGTAEPESTINHYPIKRTCLEMSSVAECIDLLQRTRLNSPACVCDLDVHCLTVVHLACSAYVLTGQMQSQEHVLLRR